jgi:hypothetical protein
VNDLGSAVEGVARRVMGSVFRTRRVVFAILNSGGSTLAQPDGWPYAGFVMQVLVGDARYGYLAA